MARMAPQSQGDTSGYLEGLSKEFARAYNAGDNWDWVLELSRMPVVDPNILIHPIHPVVIPVLETVISLSSPISVSLLSHAVKTNRVDLVEILLGRPDIDTTFGGHVAADYATTPEMKDLFEAQKAKLAAAKLEAIVAAAEIGARARPPVGAPLSHP